jgi:hypothetical protein
MASLFTVFTASGPVLGGLGYFLTWNWLFWLGVALALANLAMNLLSGSMRFPILPLAFIVAAALFLPPWYVGAGVGLLAWTAVEAIGEVFGKRAR